MAARLLAAEDLVESAAAVLELPSFANASRSSPSESLSSCVCVELGVCCMC
jgi:hypothetical protein